MKQLETRNQILYMSSLSFYAEIGIETYITQKNLSSDIELNINKDINYKSISDNNSFEIIKKKIKDLEISFQNFNGCSLKKTSSNFVKFFGNPVSKILIIDAPPDMEEDKTGSSFVSKKGEIFEKILCAIDLKKSDTFIAKCIPWRPPGNRCPTMEEIKICRPFIFNLIRLLKPKIIVCLGEIATYQILELEKNFSTLRGKWRLLNSRKISKFNDIPGDFNVLPTFNISQLLTRPDLKKYAWEDMKTLREKIREII